jgi:hypothetical protein
MIKSRRMRWKGHVARIGVFRNAYKILVGKLKPLERPRRRGEVNIRMDNDVKLWTGFIWLRVGTSGGLLWTR